MKRIRLALKLQDRWRVDDLLTAGLRTLVQSKREAKRARQLVRRVRKALGLD